MTVGDPVAAIEIVEFACCAVKVNKSSMSDGAEFNTVQFCGQAESPLVIVEFVPNISEQTNVPLVDTPESQDPVSPNSRSPTSMREIFEHPLKMLIYELDAQTLAGRTGALAREVHDLNILL